jgi:hypothetical protein
MVKRTIRIPYVVTLSSLCIRILGMRSRKDSIEKLGFTPATFSVRDIWNSLIVCFVSWCFEGCTNSLLSMQYIVRD